MKTIQNIQDETPAFKLEWQDQIQVSIPKATGFLQLPKLPTARVIETIHDLKYGMVCRVPGGAFYIVDDIHGLQVEISIIDLYASVVGKDNKIHWRYGKKQTSHIYHDLIGHIIVEEPGA